MDIAPVARTAPLPITAAEPPRSAAAEPETAPTADRADPPATTRERRIDIDPETRDVISRVVDPETGLTVSQIPAEAQLRLSAYVHRLLAAHSAEKTA